MHYKPAAITLMLKAPSSLEARITHRKREVKGGTDLQNAASRKSGMFHSIQVEIQRPHWTQETDIILSTHKIRQRADYEGRRKEMTDKRPLKPCTSLNLRQEASASKKTV